MLALQRDLHFQGNVEGIFHPGANTERWKDVLLQKFCDKLPSSPAGQIQESTVEDKPSEPASGADSASLTHPLLSHKPYSQQQLLLIELLLIRHLLLVG